MHRQTSKTARHARKAVLDVTPYRGQWISLHPRTYKVIGRGSSPEEAMTNVAHVKSVEPLLYFVPKSDAYFVGSC